MIYVSELRGTGIKGQTFHHSLGPHTLIVGPNRSGKTARSRALEWALTGTLDDWMGRNEVKAVNRINTMLGENALVQLTLSNGETLTRQAGKKFEGWPLAYPFREFRRFLASGEDKGARLLAQCLEKAAPPDVRLNQSIAQLEQRLSQIQAELSQVNERLSLHDQLTVLGHVRPVAELEQDIVITDQTIAHLEARIALKEAAAAIADCEKQLADAEQPDPDPQRYIRRALVTLLKDAIDTDRSTCLLCQQEVEAWNADRLARQQAKLDETAEVVAAWATVGVNRIFLQTELTAAQDHQTALKAEIREKQEKGLYAKPLPYQDKTQEELTDLLDMVGKHKAKLLQQLQTAQQLEARGDRVQLEADVQRLKRELEGVQRKIQVIAQAGSEAVRKQLATLMDVPAVQINLKHDPPVGIVRGGTTHFDLCGEEINGLLLGLSIIWCGLNPQEQHPYVLTLTDRDYDVHTRARLLKRLSMVTSCQIILTACEMPLDIPVGWTVVDLW